MRTHKITGSFNAHEPSGKKHIIDIHSVFLDGIEVGAKTLRTRSGTKVSWIEKRHYMIMPKDSPSAEGIEIFSDDPDAL